MNKIKNYIKNNDGTALLEATLIIPVMLTLLFGAFDIGRGIILNQKTITAGQMAADLIARNETMSGSSINNIVTAAELAYQPYASSGFGIDIASIEFDEDGNPIILWRETRNMLPDEAAIDSTIGLGSEGDGMIIVTTIYDYEPVFARHFMNTIEMREVAFTRGRKSPTVTWDSGA